ncbi:MAG: class I SAM-dependent methyltransferase [Parvibaculaceae bacterium]
MTLENKSNKLYRKYKKAARILRLKPYYQEQRGSAFAERLQMISSRLADDDASLIDIGCNIGQFTAAMARRGLFAIGIDAQEEAVDHARRLYRDVPNLGFVWSEFGLDTARRLPSADVIFCLSVHHYWTREHGEDISWKVIAELAGRSRKLFFEPASSHRRYGKVTPEFTENDEASIEQYVRRNFARAAPGKTVERLGSTASIRNEAFRTLYLVS